MGLVIGLLGGIGSGKSAVARALAARGCLVLDADAIAREAVCLPDVRAALVARVGGGILDPDGALDRPRLAALAFADPRATADLNAIVHPPVRARLAAALDAAADRTVVLDVPLLLESPLAGRVQRWLFVDAPPEVRDARLAARGWSPAERARREALQPDLSSKRARADAVLENFGDMEDLERQIDAVLESWRPI
jgi:dephospho-CoA kinase